MQNGGCHPVEGCRGPAPFRGAKFRYLAASTIEKATGKSVLPPYAIREFDGIPVAFIGLTLNGTAGIVSPVGNDIATAWKNVLEGNSGIGPVTAFDASAYATRIADGLGISTESWISD